MSDRQLLSKKTVAILSLIAEGYSYSQIVEGHPDITYLDVFSAAEEALRLNESPAVYQERMARIKEKYPRAYERWTDEDDAALAAMHAQNATAVELAKYFQRQPSAIRSRLAKLNIRSPSEN